MTIPDTLARKFQKELNSGIVSLVLLAILDRSDEPLYGYQIAKQLEAGSQDGMPVKQGTLYPVLRTLEDNGLLSGRVEPSVSGPPRKYYEITEGGREALAEWRATWTRTRDFVNETLEGN